MDFNWSLNAVDTIFSTRSLGSGKPNCPAGTFAAGYVMDEWEDVKDIYLFGTIITGFLLIGLCGALGYRRLMKAVIAVQNDPTNRATWETVSRAVYTLTVKLDNIVEKFAALQRDLDDILAKLTALQQDQTRE